MKSQEVENSPLEIRRQIITSYTQQVTSYTQQARMELFLLSTKQ